MSIERQLKWEGKSTESRRNLDMPGGVRYNIEITEVEYSIQFCSISGCGLVHLCKEGK